MTPIAFKEWALVCAALGRGEQSIILRKGGIDEGTGGFQFRHPQFFLFPTLFHEQLAKTKLPPETPLPPYTSGAVKLQYVANVEWTERITSWPVARNLAPWHIWREPVIEERFEYDGEGLNLAFIRILKTTKPWEIADQPEYGGCKSWVELPPVPTDLELTPVIDDATHRSRSEAIRRLLAMESAV